MELVHRIAHSLAPLLWARPALPGFLLGPSGTCHSPSSGTEARGPGVVLKVTQLAGGFSMVCGSVPALPAPLLLCPLDLGHLSGHRWTAGGHPAKPQAGTLLTQPPCQSGVVDGDPGPG